MLILNTLLVVAFVVQRLVELVISKQHVRALQGAGAGVVPDPVFPWMVATHVVLIAGSLSEPLLFHRSFIPALGFSALGLLLLAQLLRVWVLRTLGRHWNVRIIASGEHGVVTTGPYRWIRHPNYLVVAIEAVCLPLFHCAWLTLIAVQLLHVPVLVIRIRAEERYLMTLSEYRRTMGSKPRFLPVPTSRTRRGARRGVE